MGLWGDWGWGTGGLGLSWTPSHRPGGGGRTEDVKLSAEGVAGKW